MATKTGNAGNNSLTGTSSADSLFGLGGDDMLKGLGSGDKLRGDSGADYLDGGSGTDWAVYELDPSFDGVGSGVQVLLSSGNSGTASDGYGFLDTLVSIENVLGSPYNDIIDGSGGNTANRFEGRNGDDIIDGGGGNDKLYGGNHNDQIDGGENNDTLYGGSGDDEMFGGSGNDSMRGEDGEDFMQGGFGNDVMRGGNQNDQLLGGDGNDDLYGDAGNDEINGEAGDDFLRGSASAATGQDKFIYDASGSEDNQGDDIIFDFVDGTDFVLFDAETLSSFDQLDTHKIGNGAGVLDSRDFAVTVRSVTVDGVAMQSTIIDVSKLEGDSITKETLTFYGNVGIEQNDFVIIPDDNSPVDAGGTVVDPEPPPEQGITALDFIV